MAGHSKWANIKHKKALVDAKRGKVFTKLIRELTVSAKMGANPEDNPRLRAAIDKALSSNMKRDTIDKSIARGSGSAEAENYIDLTYEGYGPEGIAVLVECLTDNKNRAVGEVRHAFSKCGGNLGVDGSVSWLFEKKGQIVFSLPITPEPLENQTQLKEQALPTVADALNHEDTLFERAIEAGAEDVITHDDSIEIVTHPSSFLDIKEQLTTQGFVSMFAECNMVATNLIDIADSKIEKIVRLVDLLEELDDVQNVYTNCNLSTVN